MRSLMFLLVLVLFSSVPMTSSATESIFAAHSQCCGELLNVKVPVKLVKSFYWTSSSCPIRAIVFQTIRGREICVDPEAAWVNGHVAKVDKRTTSPVDPNAHMDSHLIEVAALGRPLFPGTLYDCRDDSFIPGVTLWDEKTLRESLTTRPQVHIDSKLTSSDSLSSKSLLMNVSASLKTSFLGGLVKVEGSAKYLYDTKSSNKQSRIAMYYSETSRYEKLSMAKLGKFTYPQVFHQKTATHVVTAVLYGAQAIMVFDQTFSENDNETDINGNLKIMVENIRSSHIDGEGHVHMTYSDMKMAENIACTFHGDFKLEQNPTTYMEALQTYKQLPTLLKANPQNAVPVKVWLYPLHQLNSNAARLGRGINTSLVSNTEDIVEVLENAERTCNDLLRNTLVPFQSITSDVRRRSLLQGTRVTQRNRGVPFQSFSFDVRLHSLLQGTRVTIRNRDVFSELKERLLSLQKSFSIYKTVFQSAVGRVLPAIRGEEKIMSLEDILKIHYDSPFNADMLNKWLDDAKHEHEILSFHTMLLKDIKIEDSFGLNTILHDPDIEVVVCLTFTSLKYEDPYLSALEEFLKSDKFIELDENNLFSVESVTKWFTDPDVTTMMRENLSQFRSFSEANKDEKRIRFIISVIPNPCIRGSSIYLYEQGKLTDTQFQPVSKPTTPIVKGVNEKAICLKLQKSPTGETVKYRVEYKQVNADSGAEQQWLVIYTTDEDFNLSELEPRKQYLIRYRIVSKVGVSEASDTVSPITTKFPFFYWPYSYNPYCN